MKKAQYEIMFSAIDAALSRDIIVSKAEYNRQLAFLLAQLKTTEENEYPMEHRTYTNDYTGCTVTTHIFTVGMADTTLKEIVCKPGYCIKKES